MKTIVLVTGGFDPIHSGHISYINAAKNLGDILVVGVNSDDWLRRKKGQEFMPSSERIDIIQNLKAVNHCILFDDTENHAIEAIRNVKLMYPGDHIIFANGGDRTKDNIPEMIEPDVEFVFGVGGGDKKNSSSWILQEWKAPKTSRQWGHWRVLHEQGHEVKLKELTVDPGKRLSMQRHKDRAEHWFVAEGTATVYTVNSASTDEELLGVYEQFQHVHIRQTEWHQLSNETDQPLKIIEIQYGKNCIEEDIERK
jgi:D-beta-D-heptose 7-phosphate kinase/D-beta-D-heptose 1-phosphate adenosyltransferase